MNRLKRAAALLLAIALALSITACGKKENDGPGGTPNEEAQVIKVFAPKTSVGIVSTAANAYRKYNDSIVIEITYDDGAMLASKIEAGYECDVYVADSADYLDWLDADCGSEKNPNGNDCILEGSRTDVFIGPATVYSEDGEPSTEDVTYTAAVIKTGRFPMASQAFIDFMRDAAYEEADQAYKDYGFTKAE